MRNRWLKMAATTTSEEFQNEVMKESIKYFLTRYRVTNSSLKVEGVTSDLLDKITTNFGRSRHQQLH